VLNIILSFFLTSVGKVMYQSRYLRSQSYLRNTAANRIVMGGYGTVSYPDPCKTIFQRWDTWNIGWMKIRGAWIKSSWWHLQIIVPVLTGLWYALSYNVDKNRWVFCHWAMLPKFILGLSGWPLHNQLQMGHADSQIWMALHSHSPA